MKKCTPRKLDRVVTVLAAAVCAVVSFFAFRELVHGNQPSTVFAAAGLLFAGVAIHTCWKMISVGNWGIFYNDEKIVFALSRRERWEFRWEELPQALKDGKLYIFYRAFPEYWCFVFPGEKIRQLDAASRMEGFESLSAVLKEKGLAAEQTNESASSQKRINEAEIIYNRLFGEQAKEENRRRKK